MALMVIRQASGFIRPSPAILLTVLFFALFYPSGSLSQEPIRPQKPLEYQVAVTLKLIQVYVTDKKGNPISTLNKEDFVLYDNGKLITLTEFERHTLNAPPGKAAQPTEIQIAATPTPPSQTLSRKFLLFFDLAYNNMRGVRKSKDAALHLLDTELRPGDEVGLISYSLTRGLSINEFLTADHRKVREALEALDAKGIAGRADDIEQEYWREVTEGSEGGGMGGDDLPHASIVDPRYNWKRQEMKSQAQNFIIKLTALAKACRYIPGQKHFILFSTGIASSLIYGKQGGDPTGSSSGGTFLDTGDFILRTRYEEMLKELSSASCSVFAFDTREAAMVPSLFDYDEKTFGVGRNRDIFSQRGVQQDQGLIFKDNKITGFYTLSKLSKDTGGRYFSNINEFERNLDQLQNITGTYYVLGYYIGEQWDGRFHEVKVALNKKGFEVRAQSGYFNPKPFREYSDLEKQLQLLDLALSDIPLYQTPLAAGVAALSGFGDSTLALLVRLSPDNVERLAGGKTEITTFVFDERGDLKDVLRTEDDLTRFKGRAVIYASEAKLEPGTYKCRVVARNLETGISAVATTQAFVTRLPALGIQLHPPLLLLASEKAFYLEGRKKGTPAGKPEVSWTGLYPFAADLFSPLVGVAAKGTVNIFALLPCSLIGIETPQLAFKVVLVNSKTGEKINPEVISAEKVFQNGAFIQTLAIPVEKLAAGDYILYFYAEESASKTMAHTSAAFSIR
jgi:VWFA-related protein